MTHRQRTRKAISILMLSPFYFKFDLVARRQLVKDFCRTYFSDFVV